MYASILIIIQDEKIELLTEGIELSEKEKKELIEKIKEYLNENINPN